MRKYVRLGAFMLAALVFSGLGVTTASAGSNGQQVQLSNIHNDDYSVQMYGYSQDFQYTQVYFNLSDWSRRIRTGRIDGYWWIGNVYVDSYTGYDLNGGYLGEVNCYVPRSQWWPDYTGCNIA